MTRLLSTDVTTHPLTLEPVAPELVDEGSPRAGATTLGALGGSADGVGVGIWELTEGTSRDVEVDEVFVVLTGAGTLVFDDGERIDLRPGVAVRLAEGDRTTWTITQPLRKIWVA